MNVKYILRKENMKIAKGLLLLILFLSILFYSAVFSACDTVDSEILFALAEESVRLEGDMYFNTASILRSRDEFNQYFDGDAILNQGAGMSNAVLFGSVSPAEKYNAEYFENGAIILYRFAESDNYIRRTVKSLSKEGHVLILNVDRYSSDTSVAGDVLYYTHILEVSQEDMAGFDLAQVDMAGLILDSENEAGHFFMTGFGGGLINFPYDAYIEDPLNVHDYTKIILMDSKVQTDIFSETYSQSYVDEEGWVRDNTFTDLIDGYDDAYFQDRQIVTFFATAGGGAYRFKLTKTAYADGVLKIFIDQLSLGMGHAAMVDWFTIVEIDKIPLDTEISIIITFRR